MEDNDLGTNSVSNSDSSNKISNTITQKNSKKIYVRSKAI